MCFELKGEVLTKNSAINMGGMAYIGIKECVLLCSIRLTRSLAVELCLMEKGNSTTLTCRVQVLIRSAGERRTGASGRNVGKVRFFAIKLSTREQSASFMITGATENSSGESLHLYILCHSAIYIYGYVSNAALCLDCTAMYVLAQYVFLGNDSL